MGTLMGVLEPKQYDVLASCCFDVLSQLVLHIRKKGEKVFIF